MSTFVKKTSLLLFLATLLTLLVGVTPARADTNNEFQAAPSQQQDSGYRIIGKDRSAFRPILYRVTNGEHTYRVYCIENRQSSPAGAKLKVADWDSFIGENNLKNDKTAREKVSWIAVNSYPNLRIEELRTKTGIADLSEAEAVTGTQSAIWHFSDNFALDRLTEGSAKSAENVKKLYDYYLGSANTGLTVEAPSLEIEVPQSATAGQAVGPIRFDSNAATVSVEEPRYRLVDAAGSNVELAAVPANTDLFLNIPADARAGSLELKAKAGVTGFSGQILVSAPGSARTQSVIIGEGKALESNAVAALSWNEPVVPKEPPMPSEPPTPVAQPPKPSETPKETPKAQPGLPTTGASGGTALLGVIAISAGAALVIRKRN